MALERQFEDKLFRRPSHPERARRSAGHGVPFGHFVLLAQLMALCLANGFAAPPAAPWKLTTTAFSPGGTIPAEFACSGANLSPPLAWNDPPPRTQSLALIVDDPDAPAGTWVHWVVYNLPSSARSLPQGVPLGATVAGGGEQGANDFPQTGYGGPCPPPGKPHRYYFRLFALDTALNLRAPAHRKDVDAAMKSHIVAHTELVGTFGR